MHQQGEPASWSRFVSVPQVESGAPPRAPAAAGAFHARLRPELVLDMEAVSTDLAVHTSVTAARATHTADPHRGLLIVRKAADCWRRAGVSA